MLFYSARLNSFRLLIRANLLNGTPNQRITLVFHILRASDTFGFNVTYSLYAINYLNETFLLVANSSQLTFLINFTALPRNYVYQFVIIAQSSSQLQKESQSPFGFKLNGNFANFDNFFAYLVIIALFLPVIPLFGEVGKIPLNRITLFSHFFYRYHEWHAIFHLLCRLLF